MKIFPGIGVRRAGSTRFCQRYCQKWKIEGARRLPNWYNAVVDKPTGIAHVQAAVSLLHNCRALWREAKTRRTEGNTVTSKPRKQRTPGLPGQVLDGQVAKKLV
jgi:hypothetical protein